MDLISKRPSIKQVLVSSIKKGLYSALPYINFRFMIEYFETLDSIGRSQQRRKQPGKRGPISLEHFQYRTMMCMHWANLTRFALLYLFPPKSKWVQLLLNDFFTLCYVPDVFTIYYCGTIFSNLCLYHLFYCRVRTLYCTALIRQVLIEDRKGFVLNSDRPIRKWVLWNLWVYQGFMTLLDIYIICFHCLILIDMLHLLGPRLWSLFGLLSLLGMNFSALFTYVSLVSFTFVGYLACTYIVAGSGVMFVRLDAIARLLRPKSTENEPGWFSTYRMLRFKQLHSQTMRFHFSISKIYGKFLLAFIVTNLPTNSGIVMASFMGKFTPFYAVFYPVYAIGQLTVIIAFHLNATKFVQKIHGPFKQLLALNIRTQGGSIKSRIKISNYISMFHTKKQYGITYAGFGLITMATFTKCVLLYSEVLMYNYRILIHRH